MTKVGGFHINAFLSVFECILGTRILIYYSLFSRSYNNAIFKNSVRDFLLARSQGLSTFFVIFSSSTRSLSTWTEINCQK